jgi:hypothetical protein
LHPKDDAFNYSYKSHVFSTTSYVPQRANRNLPQYKLILNNMYRIRPNTALLGYYQGYLSSYFLKLKATMLWQQNKCIIKNAITAHTLSVLYIIYYILHSSSSAMTME